MPSTASPTIYTSLIEQFWQTAALCIIDDGVLGVTSTIDRKVKITVSEIIPFSRSHMDSTRYKTQVWVILLQHQGEEPSIQNTPKTSPSKITSSPSLSSHHTSISAPSTSQPPITPTEEPAPMPHESPLYSVHSLGQDEDATEDSSKQGRKISDINTDPTMSLAQPQQDMESNFDATASISVTTAGLEISTVNMAVSTADAALGAETLVYIRRSASKAKDKGKAIMQESEPPKKIKKRVQVQMSIDEELAKKKYALQNRPFSVAEVRKNMCMYLKNQGGYKMSHFKGMSYEEIRPIFERVWDQIQSFIPMDSKKEKGSEKKTGGRRKKSLARKRARETLSEESAKKQKLEDDAEKEELQVYLNIVLEEESLDVESLATKYPIVDWETQILANDKYYYQIKRADGSVKHYKIFRCQCF
ncbi:hypothetical protein Tco_0222830 [Tanacetum coccineum]